jgi:hypothetical protein
MPKTPEWLRRFFFRTKEAVTHDEVTKRLQELERALKVAALEKPQAEADGVRLTGAAALLESIGQNNGVVLIGSVLVVRQLQADGHHNTFVRSLTQGELIHLEKHPHLLQSPKSILEALSKAGDGSRLDSPEPSGSSNLLSEVISD